MTAAVITKRTSRMNRSRRSSLTGISHRIAFKIREISKPYSDRDEEVPRDLLVGTFLKICEEHSPRHGGPLTTEEMQIVAEKWVPRAFAQIDRRNKEGQPTCI
jgi:hypothetical protein